MSLAGKVVVVAGSSGIVGSGIARAFLEKGATLVTPVRSEKSKPILEKDFEGLDTKSLDVPILDVGTEAGAAELAKHISEKYGAVDHIVSSLGAWWQGGNIRPNAIFFVFVLSWTGRSLQPALPR
jgi:NAD(P)-dependent dehydrogenase (short-subunit alcohol dehydrogenase family)